jgi:hypothetical protein
MEGNLFVTCVAVDLMMVSIVDKLKEDLCLHSCDNIWYAMFERNSPEH